VSYSQRHNEANGEDNKDGHAENYSADWGAEGPTDDPEILETRRRLQRALLATLFLAQGTPMLLGGDEFGRTQRGNNNAYCQDNDISWFDWGQAASAQGRGLTAFVERIIALRHGHTVLRSQRFLHGQDKLVSDIRDIAWFDASGEPVSTESWNNPEERRLVLRRAGRNGDGKVSILTAFFNASGEKHSFRLPPPGLPARLLVDSGDPDAPERDLDGQEIAVGPRSVVLTLSARRDDGS
jgi:isoamylase